MEDTTSTLKRKKKSSVTPSKTITVGITPLSPLVAVHGDNYTGFEIELWEIIAKRNALSFSYTVHSLSELLSAAKKKTIDIGFGAITETSTRERVLEFSHPTLDSSLMIIVEAESISLPKTIGRFIRKNKKMVWLIGGLITLYFAVISHVIWFIEHAHGVFQGQSYSESIFDALWFTVVTGTTVGYGDVVPLTIAGRVIAMATVTGGLFLFGFLTAEFASLLTASHFERKISGARDLFGKSVVTKKGTVAENTLKNLGAYPLLVRNIDDAYPMLAEKKAEAILFDSPVLLHHLKEHRGIFAPVQSLVATQMYGFIFPEKTALLELVNQTLLEIRESGEYDRLYEKWFGI